MKPTVEKLVRYIRAAGAQLAHGARPAHILVFVTPQTIRLIRDAAWAYSSGPYTVAWHAHRTASGHYRIYSAGRFLGLERPAAFRRSNPIPAHIAIWRPIT